MGVVVGLFIVLAAASGLKDAPAPPPETPSYTQTAPGAYSSDAHVVRIREVYRIDKRGGGQIIVYRVYYSDGTSRQVRVETNKTERK